MRRKEDPDYWVHRLFERAMVASGAKWLENPFWTSVMNEDGSYGAAPTTFHLVIPDVRFPNEMDFVREYGGECWLVKRPGYKDVTGHESEKMAGQEDTWDRVILNQGTLVDLSWVVGSLFGDPAW